MIAPRAMAELQTVYADPHAVARPARNKGMRICGYIGSDVPEELVLAAGYLPVRVRGDATAATNADYRYGNLAEPVTRSMLTRLVDGTYDYLDALVIDHSTDAYALLFFNLRQIRLMLPEVRLPKLYFLDVLHLPHLTTARYNRERVRELADTLGGWNGCAVTAEGISREIARGNAHRAALAEVASFRSATPIRLSGLDALALIGCAMLMPRGDYAGLLSGVRNDLKGAPGLKQRRLFVTGSNHESATLYAAIEREGFIIVGDDHDWGDRYYADPIDTKIDWVDAVTDRAMFGAPAAAKYGLAERVHYVCQRVRETGAEALLSVNRISDDAARWEFPDLKSALEAEGIPCVCVERMPYTTTPEPQLIEVLGALR